MLFNYWMCLVYVGYKLSVEYETYAALGLLFGQSWRFVT
jgi:hypothetical protein